MYGHKALRRPVFLVICGGLKPRQPVSAAGNQPALGLGAFPHHAPQRTQNRFEPPRRLGLHYPPADSGAVGAQVDVNGTPGSRATVDAMQPTGLRRTNDRPHDSVRGVIRRIRGEDRSQSRP